MLQRLYGMGVLKRTAVIWTAYMAVLWAVFGIGLLTHPQAWQGVAPAQGDAGWRFLLFILASNGFIALLMAGGNLFVRFGSVTPGLLILFLKALQIGWLAGTNGFTPPFASVAAANAAFLRVGLWETTAYALVCAVTLTKSLYVADSFPARRW
ncbi:MAG TPA: hypothetical protein PLB78_13320, partial [Anaerolineae bacterium]|nr:hypothetical protein [Anaerolineae bacterium]